MGPASYAKTVITFVTPQGDFYMFCACSFSLVKMAPLLSGAPLMFFVLFTPLSEPLEDTLGNTFGCSCEQVKITHGRD